MDMICSPSPISNTYAGPLNFHDDQQIFDNIFGQNPVMLLIRAHSSRTIEDSKTLRSKLLDLCNLPYSYIFCEII